MKTSLTEMKKMIKLANHLDSMGLHSEADVIDQALAKMAQTPQQGVRQTKRDVIQTINPQVQNLQGRERRETEVPVTGPEGVDYSKRQMRQDARAVIRSQNQDMRAADAAARAEIRGQRAGYMGQIRPQTQQLAGQERRMQQVPVAGATESRSGMRGGARSAITSLTPQGYEGALQRQTGKLDSRRNRELQDRYDLTPDEEAMIASLNAQQAPAPAPAPAVVSTPAPQPTATGPLTGLRGPTAPMQQYPGLRRPGTPGPDATQRPTGIIPLNSGSLASGTSGIGEKAVRMGPVRSGEVAVELDPDALLDEAMSEEI